MNNELLIPFNEDYEYINEKKKNKEVSLHVQEVPKESPTNRPNGMCGLESRSAFFERMRIDYYGVNWFDILFPKLI